MQAAGWASDYIGLPWLPHGRGRDGVDCWGLVRLVYAERFGLQLPTYAGQYAGVEDREDLARLVRGEVSRWQPVAAGHERTGDLAVLRVLGHDCHTGVVTEPGWVLHIMEGIDTCRSRYAVLQRFGVHIADFWRHLDRVRMADG